MNELEPYVEYHGNAYVRNAIDSHATGLKIQLKLRFEDGLDVFKGIVKRRKGKAGQIYRIHFRPIETTDFYVADVWFLGASWSHVNGTTIAFRLSDPDDWKIFRAWPALSEGKEVVAQEIEFLLFRVGDDGELVNIKQRDKIEQIEKAAKDRKGGPLSRRAGILCGEDDFLDWIRENHSRFDYLPHGARDYIYIRCGVKSRADLDHEVEAGEKFKALMSEYNRSFV